MSVKPFRFAVTPPTKATPLTDWKQALHRIEDMGFDTVVIADHFTDGYEMEPFVAMTAIAMETTRLKVQSGVLGNDYRHPVQVHRAAAMLDVISEGRLILGLGAGWMTSDYESAGLALDPPGVRVSRFAEAVAIIKGLFGPEPFSYAGQYYEIRSLNGLPKPVHPAGPKFFIGGGSQRVLGIAGREADIVGINAALTAGELGRHAVVDLALDRVEQKIEWVRAGAEKAGRRLDDLELEMNVWLVRVAPDSASAVDFRERMAKRFDVTPELLKESPSVLIGTLEECIDTLVERRERLGINHFQLDAGFPPQDVEALAPIVARLAGS
ncbi:MAG: TIGR03621 family F420-dependent LLM class oxidoreductase [Acidimicrobiia bacterium]